MLSLYYKSNTSYFHYSTGQAVCQGGRCGRSVVALRLINACKTGVIRHSSVSVFPFHGFDGNDPLLTEFANVNTVDKLSVSNRFAKRTFIQPPKLGSITERHQSVERGVHLHTVFPELVAGKIKVIIPNDTLATDVHRNASKIRQIIL